MSGVIELLLVLGFVGAVVWLPQSLFERRVRQRRDEPGRPGAGPAMDL
jgi:hypothetical protein